MRILVTRAEPEAGRTAARLRERGHEPILAPLAHAEPVAANLAIKGVAALALTSARTARMLPPPAVEALRGLPVFTVGDRTAEALRDAGFTKVRSANGDIHALASLIRAAGLPPGATVLHPGGEDRAGDLADELSGTELRIERRTVYRMVPVPALPEAAIAALSAGNLDAVLHYSPRSADIFVRLVVEAGLAPDVLRPRHACLSEAVAAALHVFGAARLIVAKTPDEESLFATLAA
jgi:uroporphyrinogen-III synthase